MIVTRVKLGKDMVLYFYDTRLKCLKFGHARINGLRRLFFFVFLRNNDKMLRTKIKVKPLCAQKRYVIALKGFLKHHLWHIA